METCRKSLSIALVLALASAELARAQPPTRYGPEFLWGAAISAHQVEGATGGGQNSDWWLFEHMPGNILNGDTADVATDYWRRYPEDLKLASSLGLNTIRTSIAWEKVEPAPGIFSSEAIEHYRAELRTMRDRGLRPMITLQHGTVPIWFQERGGWAAEDAPHQFLRYADHLVTQLGGLCDLWATINEPTSLIGEGYYLGNTPPQIRSPIAAIQATINVIRAHRLVTARIHQLQPVPPNQPGTPLRGVGLVNSLEVYEPYRSFNPLDRIATEFINELANWALPAVAVRGAPELLRVLTSLQQWGLVDNGLISGLLDSFAADFRAEALGNPVIDWIGVNYYTRSLVQFDWSGVPNLRPPSGPAGDNGWAIYPEGLERILRETSRRFAGLPVVVTENGLADATDRYRPDFIRQSLQSLDRAKLGLDGMPPVDVRGYYHWSLTDNFEWRFGYAHRFGLIAIQYDQGLTRVVRDSARVYRQEIEARR